VGDPGGGQGVAPGEGPVAGAPGADLIAFCLSKDRHPAGRPWSRKRSDTQRWLCQRDLSPVIAAQACEDIKISHMQAAVKGPGT
jgi:hypothetical protein